MSSHSAMLLSKPNAAVQALFVVKTPNIMKTILIIALFIFSISKSIACGCKDPLSVEEAYKYTEAIIHGRVVKKTFVSFESTINPEKIDALRSSLQEDNQKLAMLESKFIIELQVEVLKVFKGNLVSDTITLYTSRNGASCGFTRFEEGQDFIIYASSKSHMFWIFDSKSKDALEKKNTLWTNHCTRTKKFSESEAAELELLMTK